MNCYRSPILVLLLLACPGSGAEERQQIVSTLISATNRVASRTSASVCLEAVGKGREFLANLMHAELNLLPEYRGAEVYWLFHPVYKLALALIAANRLSATADLPRGLLEQLLALQADSGGCSSTFTARIPSRAWPRARTESTSRAGHLRITIKLL